tara:strand:- start:2514 stop:5615 length:3102 start_codon:yes stop_codon:yes gene_type:complete
MSEQQSERPKGPIAWMVYNGVTPNLLMVFLLLGGLFMAGRIKQEVFPTFELDIVTVQVTYPGASPEVIERGILLAVEGGVEGIVGIKEMRAAAREGSGTVTLELRDDADQQKVYQDIKQAVERITTLPQEAERPQVTLVARRREVVRLQIYGDLPELTLRGIVERVRDRLLQHKDISQVDLRGARSFEIHIEISQQQLRAHNLTLNEVARRISQYAVEIPGGKMRTKGGEIVIRVKERRFRAREFANIPLITTAQGATLRLRDVAKVTEGFDEANKSSTFNGKRSMALAVFRIGDQTPLATASAVREMMKKIKLELPAGVNWAINRDRSSYYGQRLGLLLKNAAMGLVLVLVLLGLFLEIRLAFWVTMGIPTSFLGAFLLLYPLGVSINIVSMFAFIIALGIVVDDAIVAGENIYEYRDRGMPSVDAAVFGARLVSKPIAFSILTNIIAFLPIYAIPGRLGKIWKVIPMVVIAVFLMSWLESLLILPAHLSHIPPEDPNPKNPLKRLQKAFHRLFESAVNNVYGPFLALCMRWRVVTICCCLALFLLTYGFVFGRRIRMILMPRLESDYSVTTAVLPFGSPKERLEAVQKKIMVALEKLKKKHGGKRLIKGVASEIEESTVEVTALLTAPEIRPMSTRALTKLWRKEVGPIVGLESIKFQFNRGGPGGRAALRIELSHGNLGMLNRACEKLAKQLAEFPNTKDIDDGFARGKQQINIRMKTAGLSLGLTSNEVGRQVRAAFYGAQALRFQRERNEVRVLVRLPEKERQSRYTIETLLIRTPAGKLVPLRQVAELVSGRAYTVINRRDARRIVTVTSDVTPIGKAGQIARELTSRIFPQLKHDFPGLSIRFAGRRADMKEGLLSLWQGFMLAFVGIYFLLAIGFGSYTKPFVILMAIPFGVVGAVIGHVMMGYNLSLLSMMGLVALTGVVINDSLVLIDFIDHKIEEEGATPFVAAYEAGLRRFRPIMLTTMTTFGGLAPMIFETSRQARFMIPMAISLGFGILFATAIILVLVPCLYMLLDDIANGWSSLFKS